MGETSRSYKCISKGRPRIFIATEIRERDPQESSRQAKKKKKNRNRVQRVDILILPRRGQIFVGLDFRASVVHRRGGTRDYS